MTVIRSIVEPCPASIILGVDVSLSSEQKLNTLQVSFLAGQMERSGLLLVFSLKQGSVLKQNLDYLDVVVQSCEVKRCFLLVGESHNVRIALKQNLH